MKCFYGFILLASLAAAQSAAAQISVDEVGSDDHDVSFRNDVKAAAVEARFFNRARYRAERAAIRKERNYLEFGSGLQGTLTSYNDSWIETSGGDNAIAMIATLNLRHVFTKGLFSIETKFGANIGYNRMKVETANADGTTSSDGVWFKNQDEFALSTAPSFKMSKNWSYGSIIKFRSQFANGYVSRTQQEPSNRKSTFMSPGYLDVSLGVTYTCPDKKWPFVVNLSPLALSAVFVESALVRSNVWDDKPGWQVYGLSSPDRTSKYEGGSSVQVDFDRTFGRKGVFRYRTTFFSFFGWITDIGMKNKVSDYRTYKAAYDCWNADPDKRPQDKPVLAIHPTVRWENTLEIKATKYISTTLNFQLYYNRAQNLGVQTQTLLSVGLSYTFKNK